MTATLDVADGKIPVCTENKTPIAYRLRRDRIEGLVLQGCYESMSDNWRVDYEWRDIPTVKE
jgi:hypothetical protein